MKKVMLIIAVTLSLVGTAQKTQKSDCGKLKVEVPPKDMSIQEYSTVHVKNSNQTSYNFDKSFNGFKLPGFKQTKDGGHIIVGFQVMPYEVETVTIKKSEHEKEEDGVKTKYYTYQGSASCHWRVVASLMKSNGDEYMTEEFGGPGTVQGRSEGTHAGASKSFDSAKIKFIQDKVASAVSSFNSAVKDRYCFVDVSKKATILSVKPKKYKYDDSNKGAELITASITAFNEGKSTSDDIKAKCNEAIGYWKADLAESDLENKKARINKNVTASFYFNIGMAYFLMEDFEQAEANMRKAYEIDKNVTGLHQQWINLSVKMKERAMNKRA